MLQEIILLIGYTLIWTAIVYGREKSSRIKINTKQFWTVYIIVVLAVIIIKNAGMITQFMYQYFGQKN